MKYLLRPLTRKMIEQLKVARAIELDDTQRSISISDSIDVWEAFTGVAL